MRLPCETSALQEAHCGCFWLLNLKMHETVGNFKEFVVAFPMYSISFHACELIGLHSAFYVNLLIFINCSLPACEVILCRKLDIAIQL